MMTSNIPEWRCLCGATQSRASNSAEAPRPGDAGLCYDCGRLLVFGDDLTPHVMTPIERRDLQRNNPDYWQLLLKVQREWNEMNGRMGLKEVV